VYINWPVPINVCPITVLLSLTFNEGRFIPVEAIMALAPELINVLELDEVGVINVVL
jgi:hypothetical protein